jgi:hypothetical protein
MKKSPKQIAIALVSAAVGLTLTGCFSYHKEVSRTATPAVEVPPAVTVAPPATTSSTTTTTTDNGVVQREHSSTYTYP